MAYRVQGHREIARSELRGTTEKTTAHIQQRALSRAVPHALPEPRDHGQVLWPQVELGARRAGLDGPRHKWAGVQAEAGEPVA